MDVQKVILEFKDYKICVGGLSEKGIDKKINQDTFRIGADTEKELAYIIVADGLGSCRHSKQGAEKIADILEEWLLEKLPGYAFLSDNVANILAKRMVEAWHDSYRIEEINNFDTTVHMAAFYKESLIFGGLGDGMVLVSYDDLVCKDHVASRGLFGNVTDSMCSLNVDELLDFEIVPEKACHEKAIVIISTDGISDDLIPEKKLTLPGYFQEVLKEKGIDVLQGELKEWLDDWKTDGHSDDKTICYLMIEKEGRYE